jgi:hypothetical protein
VLRWLRVPYHAALHARVARVRPALLSFIAQSKRLERWQWESFHAHTLPHIIQSTFHLLLFSVCIYIYFLLYPCFCLMLWIVCVFVCVCTWWYSSLGARVARESSHTLETLFAGLTFLARRLGANCLGEAMAFMVHGMAWMDLKILASSLLGFIYRRTHQRSWEVPFTYGNGTIRTGTWETGNEQAHAMVVWMIWRTETGDRQAEKHVYAQKRPGTIQNLKQILSLLTS